MGTRHLDTRMPSCYNHREVYTFFDICLDLEEIFCFLCFLKLLKRKGIRYHMKKLKMSILRIVCLIILLFSAGVMSVNAAGEQNMQAEDTRPDYVIYVNRVLNCVTVMRKEADGTLTPVKAMVCSCGRAGHATPQGTFRTSRYYDWRLMVDNTYGRYAVSFTNKILFHSVPYLEVSPDSLEWEEYNKLGENASLGCVRLSVEDSKWIYDNCKVGTTVIVYSDNEEVLPLGKPEAIKIPEDFVHRDWDPTDYDINNPWFAEDGDILSLFDDADGFNHIAYANRYPDLKEAFGYDKDALYEHYLTYGIDEGRTATR